MQGNLVWTPPEGTLGGLVRSAGTRARALLGKDKELRTRASDAPVPPSFAGALRGADVAVIAELKRRSPSKGAINPRMSAAEQARAYAAGGAAALSVLTEPEAFGGSVEDLVGARGATPLPLLKKDFHVHPIQMLEARAFGASAALLIARALSPLSLREMVDAAREYGVEVLLEVRDGAELELAIALEPDAIGINNRNLETLAIDSTTATRILPLIPSRFVGVAESGVSSRADVEAAAAAGADAVLVGSSISAAAHPVAAVRALTGIAKTSRGS